MQAISKVLIALAITALTGCQTYRDTVPAWMPGSGAISVAFRRRRSSAGEHSGLRFGQLPRR